MCGWVDATHTLSPPSFCLVPLEGVFLVEKMLYISLFNPRLEIPRDSFHPPPYGIGWMGVDQTCPGVGGLSRPNTRTPSGCRAIAFPLPSVFGLILVHSPWKRSNPSPNSHPPSRDVWVPTPPRRPSAAWGRARRSPQERMGRQGHPGPQGPAADQVQRGGGKV